MKTFLNEIRIKFSEMKFNEMSIYLLNACMFSIFYLAKELYLYNSLHNNDIQPQTRKIIMCTIQYGAKK